MAGFGCEGGADLAAKFSADGDVLQIRIGGRETARSSTGWVEGGVETAGDGADERWKSVDVSRFEFRELALFEHQTRGGVIGGEVLQYIDRGRYSFAFAVLHGLGQIQAIE